MNMNEHPKHSNADIGKMFQIILNILLIYRSKATNLNISHFSNVTM